MSFKRGVHCISVLWSRMPIISTVDSTCVSREGEFLRGAEDRIPYHQTQEASWLLLLICPRLFLWIHDVETETPEEGKPHQYWPRQLKSRSQFLHHKVKNFSNRNCGQIPLALYRIVRAGGHSSWQLRIGNLTAFSFSLSTFSLHTIKGAFIYSCSKLAKSFLASFSYLSEGAWEWVWPTHRNTVQYKMQYNVVNVR